MIIEDEIADANKILSLIKRRIAHIDCDLHLFTYQNDSCKEYGYTLSDRVSGIHATWAVDHDKRGIVVYVYDMKDNRNDAYRKRKLFLDRTDAADYIMSSWPKRCRAIDL